MGPEIVEAFNGKKLDYWVTGYGTGGTFHGAGKAIKAALPDLKVDSPQPTLAVPPPHTLTPRPARDEMISLRR